MLFHLLGLLSQRLVGSGLMMYVAFPPPSPSTATGRSPQYWIPLPGASVRCSPLFICETFNTSTMVSYLWVRLWLWAQGSGIPHLFLTCSGGAGGTAPSLSPLLHGSFTRFRGWMWGLPIQWLTGVGGTPFFSCILTCDHFILFIHFLFFLFMILLHVPA